jgi:hypothetical protein
MTLHTRRTRKHITAMPNNTCSSVGGELHIIVPETVIPVGGCLAYLMSRSCNLHPASRQQ